jgi:hypothetical protein
LVLRCQILHGAISRTRENCDDVDDGKHACDPGIAPIAPPPAQDLGRCRAETSGYNPQRLMSDID